MHVIASGTSGAAIAPDSLVEPRFVVRRFAWLAAIVLAVAAFNLSWRLTVEPVTEWDESLYAVSAAEMVESHDLVATTFDGKLDYYNSKPPLNIWLLALSFKVFGTNLFALRLVSALAAWVTVAIVVLWGRRVVGASGALLAGVVLSTAFAFLHVHAGRSGNPDALMTLLLFLIVVVMSAAERRPSAVVWLGPLLAGVFLLKGMAIALPLVFVAGVFAAWVWQGRPLPWRPLAAATALCLAPILAWAVARYRVDGWQFLRLLVTQDFLDVSTRVLDGHDGSAFFYLKALQRFQYDWLIAAAVAVGLNWRRVRGAIAQAVRREPQRYSAGFLLLMWGTVALVVPSLMRTKLWWYLNPFYPVFALGVGWVLAIGLRELHQNSRWRRTAVAAVALISLAAAEGRLIWHSLNRRNLEGTVQELVLKTARELEGQVIFAADWTAAERFVVRGIARASTARATDVDHFLMVSSPGDLFVSAPVDPCPQLEVLQSNSRFSLYRRR